MVVVSPFMLYGELLQEDYKCSFEKHDFNYT